MRFVNGKQRNAACAVQAVETGKKAVGEQAFGGDVEQIQPLPGERRQGFAGGFPVQTGINARGAHAQFQQGGDLVLHQRNQRRDDNRHARAQQRGHLIAQGFAAAGGHEHQRIIAAAQGCDDFALRAAKGAVAKDFLQHAQGGSVAWRGGAGGIIHGARL